MCKYAVVDLEMCNVPYRRRTEKFHWARETIQIGAVLLNEDLEIIDKFVTYVSPEYGVLDNFISKLTGINKNDIAKAPSFYEALGKFFDWLPSDTKIVSWSNNDELQIKHEIDAKNIHILGVEEILHNWIDCQKIFADKLNSCRCYKLSEALVAADIIYEDGAHDGLVDAYNTALLFAKMKKEAVLKLNPDYERVIFEEDSLPICTLSHLFAEIDLRGMALA